MNTRTKSACHALASLLITTLAATDALAAPPEAFLEHAEMYGHDKTVRAYRVPTKDANGKTQYFDIVINLKLDAKGKFKKKAKVSSKNSPIFLTNQLIAGDYDDSVGGICRLTLSVGSGGRQTGVFSCVDSNGTNRYQANIATGPIDGHPYEQNLKEAGIDQIPAVNDFIWGIGSIAASTSYLRCFFGAGIIGVNQVANILAITSYRTDARADCVKNFTLQP